MKISIRLKSFLGRGKILKYFIGACFIASVGAWIVHFAKGSTSSEPVDVDWRILRDLDYTTGKTSTKLDALDGKQVRIPGFMVPLEDNSQVVTEFLLVPSPQACIHVPPPPPNQMVYVQMEGKGAEAAYGPIWVYGTLRLKAQKHLYGEASFSLSGVSTSPYVE